VFTFGLGGQPQGKKGAASGQRLKREADEQAKQRRQRLTQSGSAAAFLAVCVVGVLIVASQSGSGASGAGAGGDVQDASLVQQQLKGIPQRDTVLGDPQSKVTVVEFGDLQCPVCKAFSLQIAPSLISDVVRKGTANYAFRQFTIISSQSVDAAKAAYAAGEQGRYWNFIELFYRNQGEEESGYITSDYLTSIAKGAGVPDINKLNQDRQSSKWDSVLSRTQAQAEQLRFTGTPSILVEGPGGEKIFPVIPTLSQIEGAIKSVQ
jgi:protein-disulfide isomerase